LDNQAALNIDQSNSNKFESHAQVGNKEEPGSNARESGFPKKQAQQATTGQKTVAATKTNGMGGHHRWGKRPRKRGKDHKKKRAMGAGEPQGQSKGVSAGS